MSDLTPPGGRWWVLAVLLALLAAMDFFYWRQGGDLSVQSELNLRFAGRPSLAAALDKYPRLRPPLYPALLWTAARAGLPLGRVNEALLVATLAWLAVFFRGWPGMPLAVAAYGLAHFNFVNLHQYTAEALFAPLLAWLVWALARYLAEASGPRLLAVAAATSALCLTRYFALPYAVPLVAANVLLLAPASFRRRLVHLAVLGVLALGPVGVWMWIAHRETGSWTGAERTTVRHLPEAVRYWADLAGLGPSLVLTGRTLAVDFFSLTAYAAHSVTTHPHALSPLEWAGLGALAASLAALAWKASSSERAWGWRDPATLVVEFLAGYFLVTLAVWSVGNNDPLYTRFLYPAYVLVIAAAFAAYRWVAARGAPLALRLPWLVLAVVFLTAQLARAWLAPELPVRYL